MAIFNIISYRVIRNQNTLMCIVSLDTLNTSGIETRLVLTLKTVSGLFVFFNVFIDFKDRRRQRGRGKRGREKHRLSVASGTCPD